MHKPDILNLIGIPVDALSNLSMVGGFDQQARTAELHMNAKKFEGYGMQLDSMYANFTASQDSFTANGDATELFYNAFQLGHLEAEMHSTGDTATTHLLLSKDNDRTLDLSFRFMPIAQGVYVYPDKMTFAGREYSFGRNNPVFISDTNVVMDNFLITHDEMEISVDGDLHALDVSIQNMDLTNLNSLLFGDSIVINKGMLNGRFAYKEDQKLDMHAAIDSLSLYHSDPLAITLGAEKAGDQVPFKFLLTNTSNKVDIDGRYSLEREDIDATVLMDINNLAMFRFLTSGTIDEMHGNIKGEAKVHGPVMKPEFKGFVQFKDVGFTTADPSLDFNIEDETITLDTSGVALKDFTIYDEGHYPLVINGKMKTKDFQSYSYDLNVQTDHYTLMNSPVSSTDQLKGLLVLAADMQLKGNEKDTYVKANITVRDTSSLVYVVANDEVDLLRTEGIVEFVDPGRFADTTAMDTSASFYDSLVAGLPDFNLNSTITIEKQANLRVITDEQSGDYFEASGGAKLDVGYDRSRNLRITGNYTITNGVYRLSFYNLVKKNFTLVPGSSIDWTGSPENGELNIKALHTVASNSIGLIGHEIGENEQSIYKRSLDYEVGINIKGTIEKPVVSFTLDLPKEEKTNYPVLANKLDRLKLPEFQSELNKQVFGLLVLGGFIPESSLADINENVVAATALTNSVNALLAGQLNRFAGQHIKGVNIDVGLQSYSDYSTPGGKTRTAMDFRVSKSILNDRLSFEIGGDFDINSDQSGANTGDNNYRGDMAIIYDLTGNGDKQLKLFNNETYDIIYQEVRNTGISLIFIREFNKGDKPKRKSK
jgi:hypothetical protein